MNAQIPTKILITGDPAAGKSTTATALQEKLKIPAFHTDMYMLKDACTYNPYNEFKDKINEIIDTNENYIIDCCSFGSDEELFNKVANNADIILDFDFPPQKALDCWLKRTNDIMNGKLKHLGMTMGEDYGSPKQFKFFLEYYAKFIGEKDTRKNILENLSHKVKKINDYTDADKILIDLTGNKNF